MSEMFKFIDYIINKQYVDVAPSYSRMQKVLLVEIVMFTKLLCGFLAENPQLLAKTQTAHSVASKFKHSLYQ